MRTPYQTQFFSVTCLILFRIVLFVLFRPIWVTWNASRIAVGWHETFTDEIVALDNLVDVDVKLVTFANTHHSFGWASDFILPQSTGA